MFHENWQEIYVFGGHLNDMVFNFLQLWSIIRLTYIELWSGNSSDVTNIWSTKLSAKNTEVFFRVTLIEYVMPNNVACVVFMCRTGNEQYVMLYDTHNLQIDCERNIAGKSTAVHMATIYIIDSVPTNLESTGNLKLKQKRYIYFQQQQQ